MSDASIPRVVSNILIVEDDPAMEAEANERFISHAVPWEMAIKLSLGKLRLQTDYDVIFPRRARCEWMPNAGRESRTLSCAHHSAAAPRRSI